MKILRLNLLAFGPFTAQSLDFSQPDASFHIVYGPNEAGKSSSLRALRQCFFGIPHNSGDDFLHPKGNLRIGSMLQDARGMQLEFVRRKGQTKVLRDGNDDQPIEPAELARMLGGVDEPTFSHRFGIGHLELRSGGKAIVDGGGELGDILFAAGAGIADIRQVQSRLAEEMEDLFKPGGSKPRINKALAELKAARNQIKDAELPTPRWVAEDKARREAEQRQAAVEEELLAKRAWHSRLERLIEAQPLLVRRTHWLGQQESVKDAPILPDDFAAKRSEAQLGLANAQQAEQEAASEVKKLLAAIAELHIPQALLERRSDILHLQSELGGIRKAVKDRPGVVAEKRRLDASVVQILKELGREPDLNAMDSLRLTRLQRIRIQELIAECKVRFERQASAEADLRKLADGIEATESLLATLDAPQDVAALRQAVQKARKQGQLEQQLQAARGALQQQQEDAEVELQQLALFTGTLDALERISVCDTETIDRFDHAIVEAHEQIRTARKRIDGLTFELQSLDSRLEALRLAHDVPTEADLLDARTQRDAGWQLVLRALNDGPSASGPDAAAFIKQFAGATDLAHAFQISLERSDTLGDRLRHEADQVAKKAEWTATRSERTDQLQAERRHLASCGSHEAALQLQWRQLWTAIADEPLPPREMRPWLHRRNELIERAQTIRTQAAGISKLVERLDAARSALLAAFAQLGRPLPDTSSSLEDLLESGEAMIATIEVANHKRAESERKLADLQAALAASRQVASQAEADLKQWKSDWAEAVAAIGLTEAATPAVANSVIQSIDDLLAQHKESTDLGDRIAGIDRDARVFQEAMQALIAAVASDLAGRSAELAISDLAERLAEATSAQVRRNGWQEQLRGEETKRDKAQAAVGRWQSALDSLCNAAQCADVDRLPDVERQSALRRESQKALASIQEQLSSLAAREPIETFLQDAEAAVPEVLQLECEQVAREIAQLDRARTELDQTIGGHKKALSQWDGNGRAAEAQMQVEHFLAAIRSDAEQYIRLRLAAAVLKRTIERFREKSQGPVLDRASAIFAELTLGAFSGLRADYDDHGKAVLVGVRATHGQSVHVDGMSDGTCDQLYLALRLALLESYLDSGREPLPLIVDDILIQFDDDRAAATLKVLAEFSRKTQVIFFTHHQHLVELASEHVGTDATCLSISNL